MGRRRREGEKKGEKGNRERERSQGERERDGGGALEVKDGHDSLDYVVMKAHTSLM